VNYIITYTRSENMVVYKNTVAGTPVDISSKVNQDFQSSIILRFGRYNDASGNPGRYYNGSMDDIRIYNRVLTQEEITALYNEDAPELINASFEYVSGSIEDMIINGNSVALGASSLTASTIQTQQSIQANQDFAVEFYLVFLPGGSGEPSLGMTPEFSSLPSSKGDFLNFIGKSNASLDYWTGKNGNVFISSGVDVDDSYKFRVEHIIATPAVIIKYSVDDGENWIVLRELSGTNYPLNSTDTVRIAFGKVWGAAANYELNNLQLEGAWG